MNASRPLRVLCIDDSPDDAELNVLALGKAGYRVETQRADREDAAREALDRASWDVVLCDYSMPNFSAPAMLALLAERDLDIPCLIVSGAIGEEAAAEAIRLGAYDYIFKNNLKRLGPAVDRALRDADLRRARRIIEQQLRASETRLRLLFEQLPALVITTDTDLTITSIEGARLGALGMESEALLNTRIATSALIADESRFPVRRAHLKALQGVAGEYEMIWGGKTLQGHVEPLRTESGRIVGTISVAFDITERKVAEQRLTYFSQFDLLTDLPNRTVLEDRLVQALALAARHGDEIAVFAIDLDRFKEVNESYGRTSGDELLRGVGRRLRRLFDDTATISRFGEDLFVILAIGLESRDVVEMQGRRIRDAFESPFEIRESDIYVTASIGIALAGEDGNDAHALVESAEAALLSAKQSGRNTWRFFTPSMLLSSVERITLKRDLRVAAVNEQLTLHYQPILRASDGALAGLEVLVRWQHPNYGMLMPDNFVPLAEESGAIEDVGEWVLASACEQFVRWNKSGVKLGRIAVNLSARQFEGRDLRERVAAIIERTGIAPGNLELELTESAIMRDVTGAIATLQDLKRLGVRIAVDDFGAGYTSLSFLRRFPVDCLKIDQSFVHDLHEGSHDEAIVKAIVTLATNLGLTSVAEGVEDEAVFMQLRALGVSEVQGFYLSRPLTLEATSAFLTENAVMATE